MEEIHELYELYRSWLEQADAFKPNYYSICSYSIGLCQLVVMIRPIETQTGEIKDEEAVFITFMGVEYMQLIPHWENVAFTLVEPDERLEILQRVGLHFEENRHLPDIWTVLLPTLELIIICSTIYVSKTRPDI